MNSPYKYFVTIGLDTIEVNPSNARTLQEEFSLNDNDRRFAFQNTFNSELHFIGGDFQLLYDQEQSGNKCRPIPLEIKRWCGTGYVTYRNCKLRLIDGTWDLDNCTVTIKPKLLNEYTCYEDNAKTEVNFLNIPVTKVAVQMLRGTIEKTSYTLTTEYILDDPAQFGGVNPSDLGWKCYKAEYITSVTPHQYNFYYARETATFDASENPGVEWKLLSDNGSTKTWARQPILADYTKLYVNNNVPADGQAPIRFFGGELFAYNIVGDVLPDKIDNGMLLNSLINYFISNYCGLKVVSIFLGISPDAPFTTTYPTLQDGLTKIHVLYQKSDVKRPTVSGNATIANSTFKELLTNICTIYNLDWRIQDGVFRIEHCSYYQRTITKDATVGTLKDRLVRTRKYSYKTDDLPKKETFSFMEAVNTDFIGKPIEYVGDCVSDNEQTQAKETRVNNWTTDVEACLINSDPKSNVISKDGFVLMAVTQKADGKYYPITVEPVLEQAYHVNNCLSWAYLHQTYWKHNRLQLNGYMNGTYQTFLSTVAVKKRISVTIPFCCGDVIDLMGLVNTDMGLAQIDSASFKLYNDALVLNLVYPDTMGNNACLVPRKFRFQELNGSVFTFYTEFEDSGIYNTEVQCYFPDGTNQTATIYDDTTGLKPVDFGPLQNGTYRFRKRIICGPGFISPWTDFISVDTMSASGGSTTCLQITGTLSYWKRNGTIFQFTIGEAVPEWVQCEVTRPVGSPYIVGQQAKSLAGNLTYVNIDIQAVPYGTTVPSGHYRFRFRRLCDTSAGVFAAWSDYLDVTI